MESTFSAIENKYQELLFLSPETKDLKLQFILLIHATLLTHNLKCTGRQEDDPEGEFILPENWSKDCDDIFSFRYYDSTAKDTIYVKFVCEGNLIDINAVLASKNDKIISLQFNVADYQAYDTATIQKIYSRFRNEFLVKLLPHLKPAEERKEEAPHREPNRDDGRGLLWNIPRNDHRGPNFGDYGTSDLFPGPSNPIGIGGIHSGGNLLGPRNPIFGNQNLPGSHPTIRYDPTGPGDIDPTNPDPDLAFPPFQNRDPRNPFGRGPFGGGNGPFGGGGFGGGNGPFGGGGSGFGGGGFGGGLI